MRFTVDRLDHVVLTVRDIEVSASWYQRVLGMEREEYGRHNRAALKFGGQKINLRPEGMEGGRPRSSLPAAPMTCASLQPSPARMSSTISRGAVWRSSKARLPVWERLVR